MNWKRFKEKKKHLSYKTRNIKLIFRLGEQFYICCSALMLFESNMMLFDALVTGPHHMLPLFDKALLTAQRAVHNSLDVNDRDDLVRELFSNTFIKMHFVVFHVNLMFLYNIMNKTKSSLFNICFNRLPIHWRQTENHVSKEYRILLT